jgi:hypothetical protein
MVHAIGRSTWRVFTLSVLRTALWLPGTLLIVAPMAASPLMTYISLNALYAQSMFAALTTMRSPVSLSLLPTVLWRPTQHGPVIVSSRSMHTLVAARLFIWPHSSSIIRMMSMIALSRSLVASVYSHPGWLLCQPHQHCWWAALHLHASLHR